MIIPSEYANWTWPTLGALTHVPITSWLHFLHQARPPWAVASTESFWGRQLPSMCSYETCRNLLKANAWFSYSSGLPPRGATLLSLHCASSGPSSLLTPRTETRREPSQSPWMLNHTGPSCSWAHLGTSGIQNLSQVKEENPQPCAHTAFLAAELPATVDFVRWSYKNWSPDSQILLWHTHHLRSTLLFLSKPL